MVDKAEKRLPGRENKTCSCLCLILKAVTVITCIIGFAFNSWATIDQFRRGATLVSTHWTYVDDGITIPAITVCNATGFKDPTLYHSTYEDYDRNTMSLEDFFVNLTMQALNELHEDNKAPTSYRVETIYTVHFGRCYTFYIKGKVLHQIRSVQTINGLHPSTTYFSAQEFA